MKNHYQKIFIALVVLFVLLSSVSASLAKTSDEKNLTEIVQTGDEKFDKTFREGRELIDREQWLPASEKFKSIVCDCPEKKYVDAAFYWLAFTYKKQKMFGEMNDALNRLQSNFPNSSWADDALVMRMEQPALIATTYSTATLPYTQVFGQSVLTATTTEKIPLDREEEIRLAAFRSLLASDADRAVQLTENILKPDSKSTENLKIQVIRLMTSRFANGFSFSYVTGSGDLGAYSTPGGFASAQNNNVFVTSGVSGQSASTIASSPRKNTNSLSILAPKIREILTRSYQSNPSVKIKREVILGFGRINDSESTNYLFQLYGSESDKELKKVILQSFGSSLFNLRSASTAELRKANLERLLSIVKTETNSELKAAALNSLQNMYLWSKADEKNEFVLALMQIYDSATDENFKLSVIRSLGQSNQNESAKKLMEIAKNDKSDNLRIAAINALQGSKNPEVVKFLEDLIK